MANYPRWNTGEVMTISWLVHLGVCRRYGLPRVEQCCSHKPEDAAKNKPLKHCGILTSTRTKELSIGNQSLLSS